MSKTSATVAKPGKSAHYATGRRKTSTARVFLKASGNGNITINNRLVDAYFGRITDRIQVRRVLEIAGVQHVDIIATVKGGGTSGQRGALIHGLARALVKYDQTTRPALKAAGFLTRDARKVERKKYGLKKARKAEQYSKR